MTTLYLTEQRSLVRKDGDCLVVHIPANKEAGTEKRKVRVPLVKVDQVVVYGDSTITSPALLALLEQGAEVCFLSYHGHFRGRLSPGFSKNSLIRIEQHRAHNDPERVLNLSRQFVCGKLCNMRTLLLRSNRKLGDSAVASAAASLRRIIAQVEGLRYDGIPPRAEDPQAGTAWGSLLGLEGAGTAAYFGVFGRLLRGEWAFERRVRRPPTDPVNALLSYGYTLLTAKVESAVSLVGLDPYVGYLHSSQYGKPALALDLVEEFRPIIVDSVVLTLLNNGMLKPADFEEVLGVYRLKDRGRRTFLRIFEERLSTEIRHPTFGYRATYHRCLELQVRLLAKVLMGEIPAYPPFKVR